MERITQLEAKIEDFERVRILESTRNGRYARVWKGKTFLFEVFNVPGYFPDEWAIYGDFPRSKLDKHLDEVEALLALGWKGVIKRLRESDDIYDVSVADIPVEHRGVLDPRAGDDNVWEQLECAYLKSRLACTLVM